MIHRVSTGDVNLSVEEVGQGPVALFVHGFPLDGRMWRELATRLAPTRRCLIPDLAGFGRSELRLEAVTMDRFGADLIRVLDSLAPGQRADILVLSMGGYILWPLLERFPDRFRTAVAFHTRAAGDTPEGAANRRKLAAAALERGPEALVESMLGRLISPTTAADRPELMETLRGWMRECPPAGAAAALEGMALRRDMTPSLGSIRIPTLLLAGSDDPIATPAEMAGMASAIPGGRLVTFERCGHLSPVEAPDRAAEEVREFFAASSSA
jgi:pimeloyl-ACP methyl ester carboxylesterase